MIPTAKEIVANIFQISGVVNHNLPTVCPPERTFVQLNFIRSEFDQLIRKVQLFYFDNKKIDESIRDELWEKTIPDLVNYIHRTLANETIVKNLNIQKIMRILPHEIGFIMVDFVKEVGPDLSPPRITALKQVSSDAWWASKHFSGEPIMPGNFILEGLDQTAGILAAIVSGKNSAMGWVTGYDKVRFRKKVIPGETLIYSVKLLREKMGTFKFKANAKVNNALAAECEILLSSKQ